MELWGLLIGTGLNRAITIPITYIVRTASQAIPLNKIERFTCQYCAGRFKQQAQQKSNKEDPFISGMITSIHGKRSVSRKKSAVKKFS